MSKAKKIIALALIALILAIDWVTMLPVQAQIENISTSSGIFVGNVVEGQPIIVTVQIYPAPPEGETFSNISVGIVSPLQGISGNGPWDQKNIVTDPNGVAKVTFNIPTFGSVANWNVCLYFGGQYFANNTIYYQPGHWERTFFISPVQTPTPKPTTLSVSTLGPLEIRSAGDSGTNVRIISIKENSSLLNPVQLTFRVQAALLPYCYSRVGNIGYSIDDEPVYSVNNFINQTIVQTGAADEATVWANVNLPSLSDGYHKVTVYWGWYFEGINQRYEVSAYSDVSFSVSSISPSPVPSPPITTMPTLPLDRNPHLDPIEYLVPVSIILAIIIVSVLIYRIHRKTAS